ELALELADLGAVEPYPPVHRLAQDAGDRFELLFGVPAAQLWVREVALPRRQQVALVSRQLHPLRPPLPSPWEPPGAALQAALRPCPRPGAAPPARQRAPRPSSPGRAPGPPVRRPRARTPPRSRRSLG